MNILSILSAANIPSLGQTILMGVIVLGVLVFVHELGHFLAAKWAGVRVLAFSLGFGKPLLKKTIGETEYRLCMIPFGGYVHMAGEQPEDGSSGSTDEFAAKPVWKRAIIALAGPAANVIFALLLLWVYFILGVDRPLYLDQTTIGAVIDTSAAGKAGLRPGDSIVAIDGEPVEDWTQVEQSLAVGGAERLIKVQRGDQQLDIALTIDRPRGPDIPRGPVGGILPSIPPLVGDVMPGTPADRAGIRAGDLVTAIEGDTIHSWFQISEKISAETAGDAVRMDIKRGDSALSFMLVPTFDKDQNRPVVGIRNAEPPTRLVRYSPVEAVSPALRQGWRYTTLVFVIIRQLASRQVSPRQLAGPIGIVQMSGAVARLGLRPVLDFMALIGFNLAILNLMPLVITDGGLLLFLALEAIRGKPLSIKTQMTINRVAIAFFVVLFLFVTFNDVLRIPQLLRTFR